MIPADWHPDPTGKHELRYWDGNQWTEHVADAGVQGVDPLDAGPAESSGEQAAVQQEQHVPVDTAQRGGAPADLGPDAATRVAPHRQDLVQQAQAESPTASAEPAPFEPAPFEPAPYEPATYQASHVASDVVGNGTVTGDLLDGRFGLAADAPEGPALHGPGLLRVRLTEPILANSGAVVGHQGTAQVDTAEGSDLALVTGEGEVLLGDGVQQVHLLHLSDAAITVVDGHLLAGSSALNASPAQLEGSSATTLSGTGWAAVTTVADPVVLDASDGPVGADVAALAAWSASLEVTPAGSGRAVFSGNGQVVLAPAR